MTDLTLRDALTAPDSDLLVSAAVVTAIYADGTADIDLGGGRRVKACPVLASYTPATGDNVQALRRDSSSWLVLGATRLSNATTVSVGNSLSFPYNVNPAPVSVANPFVVSATRTASWRNNEGWYLTEPRQGSYSTTYGYHRGLYFYGANAFAPLAGTTVTRVRIHLARQSSGGSGGGVPNYLAPHVHATQPSGEPIFTTSSATNVGSLAWGASGDFDLPVAYGQALVNGTAKGIGHLYLGTTYYSILQSLAADASVGRLTIYWK